MISMRQSAAIVVMAALGVIGLASAGLATGNDGPPGQGPCNHGNSGKECKPDPQPEHGKDCDEHGPNEGGVNEDHCLGTTTGTTTETTTETTTGTTTTTPTTTTTTTTTDTTTSTDTTTDPPTAVTTAESPPLPSTAPTTPTPEAEVPATEQGSGSTTETTPPERTAGVLAAARKTIRTVSNTKGARTTPNRVARVKGTVRVLPFTP
jgi:hypothetical protein